MARKKPKIDWFSPLNVNVSYVRDLLLFAGTPYEINLGTPDEVLDTHRDTKAEIHTDMSPAGWYLYQQGPQHTAWLIHLNPLHHEGFSRSKKFYQLHIKDEEVVVKDEYEDDEWNHQPDMEYSLIQETAHLTGMISQKVVGLFEVVLNWRDFPYNEQQMNHFLLQQLFG